MSLIGALNTALSGLRVTQASIAATSQNAANVQTPGYSRKSVAQEAVALGDGLGGVRAGKLERAYDAALMQELLRQESASGRLGVQDAFLARIEALQGKPEDGTSFAARLTQMRDAFIQLQSKPESAIFQSNVVERAADFALVMNQVGGGYNDARQAAQDDIVKVVGQMNRLLQEIGDLDQSIFRAGGGTSPDLLDRRDQRVRELAQIVDIRTVDRSDGTIVIMTRDGATLHNRVPTQISTRDAEIQPNSAYTGQPGGTIPAIRLGDPDTGPDITASLRGGSLGGLVELRDEILPRMQGELDELAHKIASRFQGKDSTTRQIPGLTFFTDVDGRTVPGDISGNADYSHPSTYVGFAARMRVAQAVLDDPSLVRYGDAGAPVTPPSGGSNPPDPVGGSTLFLKNVVDNVFGNRALDGQPHIAFNTASLGANPLRNLQSSMPTGLSVIDFAQQLLVKHAGEAGKAADNAKAAKATVENLALDYQNKTGVNLDDEVTRLVILQRSYAAQARVISTVEQMFDALFQI